MAMDAMPLISVIIPTYNRRDFLVAAVDSVLSQTFGDFELIVVDDGSTDGTGDVMARYADRAFYVIHEHRGVSAARNRGIDLAKGNYISFLDSDDLWMPTKLEKQMKFFEAHPAAHVCYTDELWIRRGKRVNPRKRHAKHSGWIYAHCLPLCIISPSSVCVKREVLYTVGCFDPELPVCEDYDLWLRVTARYPVHFIPERLIVKRGGHADQLSHRSWGNDRYRIRALVKMLENGILDGGLRMMTIDELHRKCQVLINGYRKRGKTKEFRDLQELLRRYPARSAEVGGDRVS